MKKPNEQAKAKQQAHLDMVESARNFYASKGLLSTSLKPKRRVTVKMAMGGRRTHEY